MTYVHLQLIVHKRKSCQVRKEVTNYRINALAVNLGNVFKLERELPCQLVKLDIDFGNL